MTIVYNGHFFSTDGVMQLHTAIVADAQPFIPS